MNESDVSIPPHLSTQLTDLEFIGFVFEYSNKVGPVLSLFIYSLVLVKRKYAPSSDYIGTVCVFMYSRELIGSFMNERVLQILQLM